MGLQAAIWQGSLTLYHTNVNILLAEKKNVNGMIQEIKENTD